jgi:hypothetical protein
VLVPPQSDNGNAQPPALQLTPRSPFATRTIATAAPQATAVEQAQEQATPTAEPSATAAATAEPAPTVATATALPPTALPTPEVQIVPAQRPTPTSEERWRAQQQDREVLLPPRLYSIQSTATLNWYDPLTGQVLEIGTVRGLVPAQAIFVFRPVSQPAIEVPYRINNDFGLTSISSALVERMRQAGYQESVEAFVLLDETIVPAQ